VKKKVYLAVDLGADSGRVMAGIHDGNKLVLEEMASFPTDGTGTSRAFMPISARALPKRSTSTATR